MPYIWLSRPVWRICHKSTVHGLTNTPLPDGSPSIGLGGYLQSMHFLTTTWVEH